MTCIILDGDYIKAPISLNIRHISKLDESGNGRLLVLHFPKYFSCFTDTSMSIFASVLIVVNHFYLNMHCICSSDETVHSRLSAVFLFINFIWHTLVGLVATTAVLHKNTNKLSVVRQHLYVYTTHCKTFHLQSSLLFGHILT